MLRRELRTNDTAPAGNGLLVFDETRPARRTGARWCVASAVLELADALDAELARTGGTALLRDVELPLVDVLARMERAGIAVDLPALERSKPHFAAKVAESQQEAWDAISRRHGQPRLAQAAAGGAVRELGLPKTKRTKTGYTTDADALAELYARRRASVPASAAGPP